MLPTGNLSRLKFFVLLLVLCSVILYSSLLYYLDDKTVDNLSRSADVSKEEDGSSYVINTPTCKIVNFGVWGPHISPHFHPVVGDDAKWPFDCHRRTRRHWTYVENANIVINETGLYETGFSLDAISCCYKGMLRIYNSTHELKHVKFTDACLPMESVSTPSKFEFIRVICSGRGFPLPSGAVLYKQFHAIALPSAVPSHKAGYWYDVEDTDNDKPPDVVIIGIDAMSRLNVRRTMVKTSQKLEEMGAVEMMGYMKVGGSTFENLAALLTGYETKQLLRLCHKGGQYSNQYETEDGCPYIWRDFDQANYTTALIEDRISWTLANLIGEGFIEKPVDFYFKPFMLGVYDHQIYHQMKFVAKPNAMDCVGHKTVDEAMLDYTRSILNATTGPKFIFSWNTNLAHEDMTAPLNVDHLYYNFLVDLEEITSNRRYVFLFMGDHGARYGDYRQTLPGWQEEKLPALWIWLSPELRTRRPEWLEKLKANSRKLTSAFDVYRTLKQVLGSFATNDASSAARGTSGNCLFDFVVSDNRTCADAGIPPSYCVCSPPTEVPVEDYNEILEKIVQGVLSELNQELQSRSTCSPLAMRKILSAAIIQANFTQPLHNTKVYHGGTATNYLIKFYADPGEILIEANVAYDAHNKQIMSGKNDRINRMTRPTNKCIQDNRLEKFCFCE